MIQKNKIIDRFNSGIIEICIKENKRIKRNLLDGNIRYKDETLGVTRFYEARVADSKITKVISIPYQHVINNDDKDKYAVNIDDEWYDVDLVQVKSTESFIPKVFLTLKKGGISYVDERHRNQ